MPENIKLYALSTCGHCRAAKKLLDECGVEYDKIDVDLISGEERIALIEAVKQLNPRCTFPTLVIGDQVIVGFHEEKIKEVLGL